MTRENSSPRDLLRLAGIAIFVAGLLAAVSVYIEASGLPETNALGYRIVGGKAFAVTPNDDSSRELQQIERLGGKAAVMTFKFQRWFSALWQGQRLAYTLLVLSGMVALPCFHFAGLVADPGSA